MFLELIGTVFAGIAMAGIVLSVNKFLGGRLPKWCAPVSAGLAMIAMTIVSEYSWYDRTKGNLPGTIKVIQSVENKVFYRPWTYAAPYVDRFAAVDYASVQRNSALPDQLLADMYFFGRWAPVSKLPIAVNCATRQRANLVDGARFGENGALEDADWVSVEGADPLLDTLCQVG